MPIQVPSVVRSRMLDAGWVINEAYRIYPPADTDPASEAQLLFIGKELKAAAERPRPLTAYLPNAEAGTVIVGEDW